MPPDLTDPTSVGAWLADRLEEDGFAYALGGAVALAAHGFPRNTADVDISVFVPEGQLAGLFDSLDRAGCRFDREHARSAVERISLFTVRCGRVAADLFVSFHPHHHEALARRVSLRCPDGNGRWFLSAEDMVIHKLVMSRQKDLMDLELLFTARGSTMDVGYVRRWIDAITPPGDQRRATLDDLQRRFAAG